MVCFLEHKALILRKAQVGTYSKYGCASNWQLFQVVRLMAFYFFERVTSLRSLHWLRGGGKDPPSEWRSPQSKSSDSPTGGARTTCKYEAPKSVLTGSNAADGRSSCCFYDGNTQRHSLKILSSPQAASKPPTTQHNLDTTRLFQCLIASQVHPVMPSSTI